MNWWIVVNTLAGIACGALMMHLWWLRRWDRVAVMAEHFRELRNAKTEVYKSEQNELMSAAIFGAVVANHYAYECTMKYIQHGQPIMKVIEDIGPPPNIPPRRAESDES